MWSGCVFYSTVLCFCRTPSWRLPCSFLRLSWPRLHSRGRQRTRSTSSICWASAMASSSRRRATPLNWLMVERGGAWRPLSSWPRSVSHPVLAGNAFHKKAKIPTSPSVFSVRWDVPARPEDTREHHPAAVRPRLRRSVRLLELQPGRGSRGVAERRLPHPGPSRQLHHHILQLSGQLRPADGGPSSCLWCIVLAADTRVQLTVCLCTCHTGPQQRGVFLSQHSAPAPGHLRHSDRAPALPAHHHHQLHLPSQVRGDRCCFRSFYCFFTPPGPSLIRRSLTTDELSFIYLLPERQNTFSPRLSLMTLFLFLCHQVCLCEPQVLAHVSQPLLPHRPDLWGLCGRHKSDAIRKRLPGSEYTPPASSTDTHTVFQTVCLQLISLRFQNL